jgi:hypothetical protein
MGLCIYDDSGTKKKTRGSVLGMATVKLIQNMFRFMRHQLKIKRKNYMEQEEIIWLNNC